jgi:hypothetical protein
MLKKLIARIFGFDETIQQLTALIKNQRVQLDVPRETQFVTVEVPQGDGIAKLSELLKALASDKLFSFYLISLENNVMAEFVKGNSCNGSGVDEQARGALRMVWKIRGDLNTAANPPIKKDSNDLDAILKNIERMTANTGTGE